MRPAAVRMNLGRWEALIREASPALPGPGWVQQSQHTELTRDGINNLSFMAFTSVTTVRCPWKAPLAHGYA